MPSASPPSHCHTCRKGNGFSGSLPSLPSRLTKLDAGDNLLSGPVAALQLPGPLQASGMRAMSTESARLLSLAEGQAGSKRERPCASQRQQTSASPQVFDISNNSFSGPLSGLQLPSGLQKLDL